MAQQLILSSGIEHLEVDVRSLEDMALAKLPGEQQETDKADNDHANHPPSQLLMPFLGEP